MKKINKKNIALWLGVSVGFAAIFGTSAALYFTAGELKNIADKKEYLIRNSSKLTLDGYYFDISASYGSAASKTPQTLISSGLIRVQTTGETKFKKDSEGNLIVSQSSEERLVLDLAKEVVLTFKNNTNGDIKQAIFDSDSAEINESISQKDKPETVKLSSNNKKSINSDNFSELMLGSADFVEGEDGLGGVLVPAKSGSYQMIALGFTVKDDIFWVDSNGNKTEYRIQPKDFYYSYMRTWLFDTKYRRSHGGSENLDKYFINLSGATNRFTDDKEYPNDYLLGLFGISSSLLQNESTAITTVEIDGKEKEMFNVNAIQNATDPNFSAFLDKTLLNSYLLSPAPSEFIDKLAKENEGVEYPVSATEKEIVKDEAHKFGIYTYGQKRSDNLFSSAYVPTSGEYNRIVFHKNTHFANTEFLAEENTLNKIIFEYSTSPTYNEQIFNNFFEGTISEMPYASLTQQQKIKIFGKDGDDKFAIEKGLLQVKQQNKSTLVQRTLLSTDPRKFNTNEKGNYYFNDQYAKIIYGSTIEQLKAGTATTAPSFFNGPGYELRTLFNASINWFTFVNNSSKGLKQLWLNHTAPNAVYNFSSDKTPLDFADKLNNIGYFKDGEKIVITEAEMKKSFSDNLNSIDNQYKSPNFDEIKTLVEKLLDENGVTEPLEWSIVYPYEDGVGNRVKIDQLELVAKTLRSLDSKGRIKPTVYVPSNRDEVLDAINNNKSVSDFNGWGYDYEGIGSFLDGISHGKGISLLGAFSLYSNPENATIRKQNPEFTKLSNRMKNYLNPILPEKLKVEDWINFTNDQNNNIDATFGSFAIGTELAKFFLMYQDEINENEITNLITELNIIAGFAMETDISIDDPNATSLSLVLPEYLFPTTSAGILYLSDIRLGDKND